MIYHFREFEIRQQNWKINHVQPTAVILSELHICMRVFTGFQYFFPNANQADDDIRVSKNQKNKQKKTSSIQNESTDEQ